MKVIVTGASGFLGTSLCRALKEAGHDVVELNSKNCDLTKVESLSKFNDQKYDQIFHLAAWTQAGDFCIHHPGEQWVINQQINTHVLKWWNESQPQAKLVCMGTSCSYSPDFPLQEDYYMQGEPIDSLYTYAMTKRMLYQGVRALNKQYGHTYLCTVPSTLYGPGYHTDGRQMHFIFDLMRKIIQANQGGDEVVLWGDGYQKRELVFVEDFVKVLLKLTETCDNELINIGAGEEYTIREFAGIICDVVGYDAEKIKYDTSKYTGAKSKCLDITKINKVMPDFKATELKIGIAKTIAWMQESYSKAS
jgi:GDP-L-fucose synthase